MSEQDILHTHRHSDHRHGDDDKPHEECGIFGIYAPGRDVSRLTFFGLYALQHRGQESAGIATCDGRAAYLHKEMGLVSQVFNEDILKPLKGSHAIGHNRYSTTGSSNVRNAAPYLIETIYGPLGVAHNGNLTNALQLRRKLLERGVGLSSTTDSEVVTQMLAAPADAWAQQQIGGPNMAGDWRLDGDRPQSPITNHQLPLDRWQVRLMAFMQVADGAYSLTVLTKDAVYGVRDPLGLRPLCIGRLSGEEDGKEGSYVFASETCALHTIGATFVRDVEPGEIVRLDANGLTSIMGHSRMPRALCSFEYVYFARPDSVMEGQVIHNVRQQLGRQLAQEAPAQADLVIAVPDSSTPHAIGFSDESGIPFGEGLIKNRYIGRTFIQPDNELRKAGVKLKYNPLSANLRGKRIALIDDSIVRGTTSGPIVQLLRDAGATEVHVRVASPAVRHPCFMGVDMATYTELIAHRLNTEEICQHIGADSLAYLSLEGMNKAIRHSVNGDGRGETGHCTACFSGIYPINIPAWLFRDDRDKLMFEETWG
jgi:amidophosphoribosyltransferase